MSQTPAMTSDYVTSQGNPEPYLRHIAEAGFRHLHWCHQWNTDFLYDQWQLRQIEQWLADFGLSLNDLHGSAGREKGWGSPVEYQRLAGLELVRNRIDMTRRLDSDVVVMHLPPGHDDSDRQDQYWSSFRRSLDELQPYTIERGVRIALENSHDDNFPAIDKALSFYSPEFLGLCYDSGHGNVAGNGLDRLEKTKDRLIAVHLHDNNGAEDKHWLPFAGSIDWPRLARLMASGGYAKSAMTMEPNTRNWPIDSEAEYLKRALESGQRFAAMVEQAKQTDT